MVNFEISPILYRSYLVVPGLLNFWCFLTISEPKLPESYRYQTVRVRLRPDPYARIKHRISPTESYLWFIAKTEAWSIILKTTIRELAGVDGYNPAWDILIRNLDFRSQIKISQLNQRLEDVARENAEYELRKVRRRIRDDKYMYVIILSHLIPIIIFILVQGNILIQRTGHFTGLLFGYSKT